MAALKADLNKLAALPYTISKNVGTFIIDLPFIFNKLE